MPELLPRMDVADVTLDERDSHPGQCISQSNTGVREASWIDDDILAVATCLVYSVDDSAFVV